MKKQSLCCVLALAVILLATSFINGDNQYGKFMLLGTTSGFADSTLIFLDSTYYGSLKNMDSAYIIDNKFLFSGSLKENALFVILRTKDYRNISQFWLENRKVWFTGENGKFKQAIIKGSKTQKLVDRLNTSIANQGNQKAQEILFIKDHPKSIYSAYLLYLYCSTWGKDSTTLLYNNLSQEIKGTFYGTNVSEFIKLNRNIKIGDKCIDFAEKDTDGNFIRLSDFLGRVTLLEFWGSWCEPCMEANPALERIYNKFKSKGFQILGVGAETNRKQWMKAIKLGGVTWPNVTDMRGDRNKAAVIYGVSYYPTNFLIDKKGTIVARDVFGKELEDALKRLL